MAIRSSADPMAAFIDARPGITLDIPDKEPVTVPVDRAGVLLFSPAEKFEDWRVLLAKPIPKKRDGNPPFQLAKGSRQVLIDGTMQDVDDVPPEKLAQAQPKDFESYRGAGMSELTEEAGAMLADTKGPFYDAGAFTFRSATSGDAKGVYIHAVQAINAARTYDFDAGVTKDTAWLRIGDFNTGPGTEVREDQIGIIHATLKGVEKALQTNLGRTLARDAKGKETSR